MQPQDVTRVLSDPLAQELMQSSIPARLAYLGPDGFPRAIPVGFHWNGIQCVLCTVPHAPKVSALIIVPRSLIAQPDGPTPSASPGWTSRRDKQEARIVLGRAALHCLAGRVASAVSAGSAPGA
jgi:hypothetical protein